MRLCMLPPLPSLPHTADQGEVTCNLYSLYMSEVFMKLNRTTRYNNRAKVQGDYFASGVWPTSFDTNTGIHQIMQITENAGGRLNYTGVACARAGSALWLACVCFLTPSVASRPDTSA